MPALHFYISKNIIYFYWCKNIILETSQGCCIEKSTENSERDIFHFFITTHVVLLQVEDLLHSLTPSALLKKI